MRPTGADNYVKWRRTIDEHLELRRLTWDEYAMFNWLCTKASPRTGSCRTSWRTLAEQTGLTANHVEKLCRSLKRKRYVWYPPHRGARGRLVEVAIDKFPTVTGAYTDLSPRFAAGPADLAADVPGDLRAQLPAELRAEGLADLRADVARAARAESRGLGPGRSRPRSNEQEQDRDGDARVLRAPRGLGARAEQMAHRVTGHHPVAVRDLVATHPIWRIPTDGGDMARTPSPDRGAHAR